MDSVNLDMRRMRYNYTMDLILPALQPPLALLCDNHKTSI